MITKLLFSGQSAFVNPIKIIAVETWPLRNATFEIRLTPNSSKSVTWSNRIFGAVFNTMPNRFCLLLNHYIICNVMNISKFCKIRKVKFDRRLKNCQTLKLLSGSTRNFQIHTNKSFSKIFEKKVRKANFYSVVSSLSRSGNGTFPTVALVT